MRALVTRQALEAADDAQLRAIARTVLDYTAEYVDHDCLLPNGKVDGILVGLRMSALDIQSRMQAVLATSSSVQQ